MSSLTGSKETINTEEILKKFDRESDYRELTGFWAKLIAIIAIAFSIFQLYTGIFGTLDALKQRSIHVAFAFCLIFLLYPARKKWSRSRIHPFDVFLSIFGVVIPMYLIVFYEDLVMRSGTLTTMDFIVGIIAIVLVFEATRRVVGTPILFVTTIFLLYALLGPYIPGMLAHKGVELRDLVWYIYFTTEGIFGLPVGVSSTFIFLFILFGAFLEKTGMGQFFIDLSNAVAGWAAGGPAKVAVISSGLMGTVSGSSCANVAGTGSFTIPMMKRLGYKPEFAGAVEAAASTGGQLMPPIMGAAAFLISEFTETPYVKIIAAAAIPAFLYYFGIFIGTHLEAKRLNLKGLKREELPSIRKIIIERGHLMLPLIGIVLLLIRGRSPMRAAIVAIALSVVCCMIKKATRITFRDIIGCLEQGARNALAVVTACACAGIIIGVVTKTGLGLKMGSMLIHIARGNLLITLFFTMITSIILGMGVPTTANYVITSTIAAPALVQMDVPLLAAHLFCFYFGIIADITPPVALAAFTGAGIAKADPLKTGFNAVKLAIAAFIVPYIFVYNPEMLLIDSTPFGIVLMLITSIIGITCVASAASGFLLTEQSLIERIIILIGGCMLIIPGLETDLIGAASIAVAYLIQKKKAAKKVNLAKVTDT
ncbi:MAG: TRAP transporter permease [Clostridiaceae bacterium]|nr:TRAP transporter permease [Clostridiaceae bacterium]